MRECEVFEVFSLALEQDEVLDQFSDASTAI